ncbi:MAG: hypothetical protein IJQ34_01905 [Kiritimatiellae bacterium]|nr:hypothetical protein [Kiritimatiellia bacterium]MBR0196866.1 hypothetical protein [Kiritimatiellia bacterium]
MKRMQLIAIAFLAITGCAKQDYSDPMAFMEHYGQELISKRFGPEKEILGLDYFKFSKVKIGIDPFKGEFVSAALSVVPKRGMKYHRLAKSKLTWVDCSLPDDSQHKYIDQRTMELLRWIGERLNQGEYCPVIYDPEEMDTTEKFGDMGRVRIYRSKDSSGILRPLSGHEAICFYEHWNEDGNPHLNSGSSHPKCNFSSKTIGNEVFLKRHNAVAYPMNATEMPEVVKTAIVAYNNHVVNLTNAFLVIRETVKELKDLDARSSNPNDDYYWVEGNVQNEYNEAKAVYDAAVRMARKDLDNARNEAKSYEGSIKAINYSLRKARERLQGAQSSYETTLRIANATDSRGRRNLNRDRAHSQLPQKETYVAECREKVARLEKELADAQAGLSSEKEKIVAYEQAANKGIAEAKSAFDAATKGLKEKWRTNREKTYERAKSRLDRAIKTVFDEVAAMQRAIGIDSKK